MCSILLLFFFAAPEKRKIGKHFLTGITGNENSATEASASGETDSLRRSPNHGGRINRSVNDRIIKCAVLLSDRHEIDAARMRNSAAHKHGVKM